MDPRLESWKREHGKDKVPTGMHITFSAQNFPDYFPNYVREALAKIRVPLRSDKPEFEGDYLIYPNIKGGNRKYVPNDEHTFEVSKDAFLSSLEKIDPKAVEWYESQYDTSRIDYFVFRNELIESIVD